jgi:UDP-N-acetyl-D-glucosamine dehydrogenase
MNSELIGKLDRKTATIGIVGLGYVGLPLMLRYCEVGYKVVGFDIDQVKVDSLRTGKSYIEHITPASVQTAIGCGFNPTTDFSRAAEVDALVLCVPTPLNKYREPDLSFVLNTVESLVPQLQDGKIQSQESKT